MRMMYYSISDTDILGKKSECSSLVKIFAGSSKIFNDPQRSAKICKGLVKIFQDKDLLKILTDPRGFLEDPIKTY